MVWPVASVRLELRRQLGGDSPSFETVSHRVTLKPRESQSVVIATADGAANGAERGIMVREIDEVKAVHGVSFLGPRRGPVGSKKVTSSRRGRFERGSSSA